MSRRIHFVHLPCLRMSKLVGRLVVGVVGGVFEEKVTRYTCLEIYL
jgi:hypothetical protein